MKVIQINTNFRPSVNPYTNETYMEFDTYNTNSEDIEKIEYHSPMSEGDAHYCDIYYTDGLILRVFRPKEVFFKQEEEE